MKIYEVQKNKYDEVFDIICEELQSLTAGNGTHFLYGLGSEDIVTGCARAIRNVSISDDEVEYAYETFTIRAKPDGFVLPDGLICESDMKHVIFVSQFTKWMFSHFTNIARARIHDVIGLLSQAVYSVDNKSLHSISINNGSAVINTVSLLALKDEECKSLMPLSTATLSDSCDFLMAVREASLKIAGVIPMK